MRTTHYFTPVYEHREMLVVGTLYQFPPTLIWGSLIQSRPLLQQMQLMQPDIMDLSRIFV